MTKPRKHEAAVAPPKAMAVDPAHAPGKHHIAREVGSAQLHALDRRQQHQRMTAAPSTLSRRSQRGRSST